MKAKEVLEKYKITRRTLHNWVKRGIIGFEKTPSGRYIYLEVERVKTNDVGNESL